ncbi:MAG: GNAT family N-acetyltransferase [Victivallales bacterium]|nr:GNAT family N-acetyltransferase [Victivallales bacterium]
MDVFEYSGLLLEQIFSSESAMSFDCGDKDLNEYFLLDSANYRRELLTASYHVLRKGQSKEMPIAFVDFCNDAIRKANLGGAKRKIHHLKRGFKTYPAVKITRIGVRESLQGCGIGSLLLDAIKHFFSTNMKSGCRFLTLDAYPSRVDFYKKNRFKEMIVEDDGKERDTIPMFFDLKELSTMTTHS